MSIRQLDRSRGLTDVDENRQFSETSAQLAKWALLADEYNPGQPDAEHAIRALVGDEIVDREKEELRAMGQLPRPGLYGVSPVTDADFEDPAGLDDDLSF